MKRWLKHTLVAASLLLPLHSQAQFTLNGNEATKLKWSEIETNTYSIIYPEGLDSLAKAYAIELESAVEPVNYSSAFRINQSYKSKWPVLLHPYASYSNGSVSWPPHRMELYTSPDAYAPEAMPWQRMLSIHESRHVAQMQYGAAYPFTGWKYILGEFSSGALAALYCGSSFFEGDAVVAETALTNSGRGRSADFLEYMRLSLSEGDMRSFNRWRYGSMNRYSPDYYKVSYLYYGGVRTYFDTPDFNKKYFETVNRYKGVAFFINDKMAGQISGKRHDALFMDIADSLARDWRRDEAARAPFMPSDTLSHDKGRYTDYHDFVMAGEDLYAVRSGLTRPSELVKLGKDSSIEKVRNFPANASAPKYSPTDGRLYWSEYTPNPRWEMQSSSDIRYMDEKGRFKRLTRNLRYYNPAPSPDKGDIAVAYYPYSGGSMTRILDSENAEVKASYPAPDGLQVVELTWVGDKLYASGLSNYGFGIYDVKDSYKALLEPHNSKIKELWSHEGELMFTSDHSGVNELYSFNPGTGTGTLTQLSNTRYGAADFQFNASSDTLYYSSLGSDARRICATAVSELKSKKIDWTEDRAFFPMADKLSSQEKLRIDESREIEISEPKSYHKLPHAFRIHSWLPFYFDYDRISSLSMSTLYSTMGIGATVFSQNTLGTLSGYASYKADPFSEGSWRHSGVINLSYTGLYPVLEAKITVNQSNAYDYILGMNMDGTAGIGLMDDSRPGYSARMRMYVPLNFSGGGWQRGLVPSLSYTFTNDKFHALNGNEAYMSRASLSLRGYTMESTPPSRVYPRLGVGAELGISTRTEVANVLGPSVYAFLYGYLPGLTEIQGINFSIMHQRQLHSGYFCESYANVVPRGYPSRVNSALASYPNSTKFSVDYAIPFFDMDWYVLLIYLRNLELTPHFDISLFSGKNYIKNNLWSAGADLCVRIGTLGSSPVRVGVSYNYLGGSLYPTLERADYISRPHNIGLKLDANF